MLPWLYGTNALECPWEGLGSPQERLIPILTLSNPRSPNRGARWT